MVITAALIVLCVIILLTVLSLREFGPLQTVVSWSLAVMLCVLCAALIYLTGNGIING